MDQPGTIPTLDHRRSPGDFAADNGRDASPRTPDAEARTFQSPLDEIRTRRRVARWIRALIANNNTQPQEIVAVGRGLDWLGAALVGREVIRLSSVTAGRRKNHSVHWDPPRMPLPDKRASYVVILDELAFTPPAHRARLLHEAARVAVDGVVVVGPFNHPEVITALQRVQASSQGANGHADPLVRIALPAGLPEMTEAVALLEKYFSHVQVESFDALADWDAVAGRATAMESGDTGMEFEEAAAAVNGSGVITGPSFRQIIIAGNRPAPSLVESSEAASRDATSDLMQFLTYMKVTQFERDVDHRLAAVDRRLEASIDRLSQTCADMIERLTAERDGLQADFERVVRNLNDDINDLETENTELRRQRESLIQERDSRLAEYHTALTDAQHRIQVMEATRGWKALVKLRQIRYRLQGR